LSPFWTIKISSPFFLFLAWRPSLLEVGITGHNFGRGLSKDYSTKVWFKLAQWLQRSWLKCEKLTDGRTDGRTTNDGRSVVTIAHLTLWVRWAKNEYLLSKLKKKDNSNDLYESEYKIQSMEITTEVKG
jgi:hypothetical protein